MGANFIGISSYQPIIALEELIPVAQSMLQRAVGILPEAFIAFHCERTIPYQPVLLAGFGTRAGSCYRSTSTSTHLTTFRYASSSSSTRWKSRQFQDSYAKEAKVAGLKSRAAFKLLEINDKYRLFKRGDTVVDLGYAPGSWSQVAVNRTQPGGRVVGIDVIPAQPPRGVSTIQGDFLSPEIREEVRRYVQDPSRGRARSRTHLSRIDGGEDEGLTEDELEEQSRGLIERELHAEEEDSGHEASGAGIMKDNLSQKEVDRMEGRVVNVVLSDMSEPWPQTASTWIRSISNPHRRMMNTSGNAFRDHAGSMVRLADYCSPTEFYNTLLTLLYSGPM